MEEENDKKIYNIFYLPERLITSHEVGRTLPSCHLIQHLGICVSLTCKSYLDSKGNWITVNLRGGRMDAARMHPVSKFRNVVAFELVGPPNCETVVSVVASMARDRSWRRKLVLDSVGSVGVVLLACVLSEWSLGALGVVSECLCSDPVLLIVWSWSSLGM